MKTEKEQIIEEIISYPTSYALMWHLLNENKVWDEDKLKFTELNMLKNYIRDIKTMERNKKEWYGEN